MSEPEDLELALEQTAGRLQDTLIALEVIGRRLAFGPASQLLDRQSYTIEPEAQADLRWCYMKIQEAIARGRAA